MKTITQPSFNVDRFYSAESIDDWKKIIGEDLHYHFGRFNGAEDLETGLKQTVRHFYPHIPMGSKVLDIGCGWGGPAKLLLSERDCTVEGITCSHAQVDYCRSLGLSVWQQNLECDLDHDSNNDFWHLLDDFDVVFSLEMISHIRDKTKFLRRLRDRGSRLIISESCIADSCSAPRETFGGSMILCSVSELVRAVEAAGWKIQSVENRRFSSLRTIVLWQQNLDRYYGDSQPPGQIGVLRRLVASALRSPLQWGQSFPLIDIVAN